MIPVAPDLTSNPATIACGKPRRGLVFPGQSITCRRRRNSAKENSHRVKKDDRGISPPMQEAVPADDRGDGGSVVREEESLRLFAGWEGDGLRAGSRGNSTLDQGGGFTQQDAGENPVIPRSHRAIATVQTHLEFVFDEFTAFGELGAGVVCQAVVLTGHGQNEAEADHKRRVFVPLVQSAMALYRRLNIITLAILP